MSSANREPSMDSVLSFAVVGHPNEGKSSVVSTLTERDDIRISATPGETEQNASYTVEILGHPMLRFIDTPGFQVPSKTRKWLERRPDGEDARVSAEAFKSAFGRKAAYHHDREILQAVARTHGLLYIVDATKPIGPDDYSEMEILRRLGRTRMAILNNKGEAGEYLEDWKAALNRHFNSIRVFNARQASFEERLTLIESLGLTGQHWETDLDRVIRALKDDRRQRFRQAALIITDMVSDCMSHRITAPIKRGETPDEVRDRLSGRFGTWIVEREKRCHADLRSVFRHNRFDMPLEPGDLVNRELFSRDVWMILGLKRRQLALAAAAVGAAGGAVVDLALGEITFGAFMAGGAIVGGASGLLGGRGDPARRRIGRHRMEIGPPKNIQMAYVLIDRALLYLDTLEGWAHANRQAAVPGERTCTRQLSRDWNASRRGIVSRLVGRLWKDRSSDRERDALQDMLHQVITGESTFGDG